MLQFSHIGISCSDIEASEKFYVKHFGFKRARMVPLGDDNYILFLKNDHSYLELFKAETERPIPPSGKDGPNYPGWRHIAFQVEDVALKLAEMGKDADISMGPLDFSAFIENWKTVWIKDPDGNIIEISQGYKD